MTRKCFHKLFGAAALITLAGCGVRASKQDAEEKNVKARLKPTFITEMVEFDTDDPAIWINPDDRSKSLIIGTDKNEHGGLYVFDLDGKEVKDKTIKGLKRPNNVDIEYGLLLNGKPTDIAVVTERMTHKLRIYRLPDMKPVDKGGIPVFEGEDQPQYRDPMGISLYKDLKGKVYAVVSRKAGPLEGAYLWQYELGDDGTGNISAKLVRKLGRFSGKKEIESIAIDDKLGYIYYSDETAGVRKYYADPSKGNEELALFGQGQFKGDNEGISIYETGDSTGYILVSNQQANTFMVYPREGVQGNPHQHALIAEIPFSTIESDGSEVTNVNLGEKFPKGLFVAMSNGKVFQYYDWRTIEKYLRAATNAQVTHYLGTKTPYSAPLVKYTPPPPGYRPVFISHVGRHGARFLTKAGADQEVMEVLQAAEKRHALTALGQQVAVIARRLQAAGKGNYERITLKGGDEQSQLGRRMRDLYAPVFKGRGLEVVTTWKLRTQQSAEAFLKGFGKYQGPENDRRASDSTDPTLRFYDLSPAYQRYKKGEAIKASLDSLDQDARTFAVARRVCARLFKGDFVRELIASGKEVDLTDHLYDLYAIAWSMSGELKTAGHPGDKAALGVVFSGEDLEWLDFRGGAADFLEKGPGFDSTGIQVKVAAPLLADFINSVDSAARGQDGIADAVLRFTHAEAISPFAALMGIQGASTPVQSIYRYHDHWQAGNVIPLSANIQWILYAGSDGRRLVKVLLNEKEVVLPVATSMWPYYRWEDLRAYYVEKLHSLHADLQTNMLTYLRGLD
ncbi:MAG TPA: phytase [Puia sp.]|nr:phytase [Puia sp.]